MTLILYWRHYSSAKCRKQKYEVLSIRKITYNEVNFNSIRYHKSSMIKYSHNTTYFSKIILFETENGNRSFCILSQRKEKKVCVIGLED